MQFNQDERLDGYSAFCLIKKSVVKKNLIAELPTNVTIRQRSITQALSRDWNAISEMEKTQWRELAIEAPNPAALRRLLVDEPLMMPGDE